MSDDAITYDPNSPAMRRALADTLLALFERSLFEEVKIPGTKERVFAREVPDTGSKIRVVVYSTIVGDECRKVSKDAIRVCALYKSQDGQERGIASADKRVNRTGTLDAIPERVIDRMRQVWKATKTTAQCPNCGAPKFKSKKGHLVCADLCWKTDDYRRQTYNRRYNSGRDYAAAGAYAKGW